MISSKVLVIALLLIVPITFSHGPMSAWERLGIYDPVNILILSSTISGLFILFSLLYRNKMGVDAKKIAFIFISVPIMAGTLYISGATVYQNIASVTGGPVHWHADYEIWACGQKYELADPSGLENRVGTPTVHEHNDNRIHIEGVLLDLEDASLHEFFESAGGEFTGDTLAMPTNAGLIRWTNGDLCSNRPARWYMFVNSVMNDKMGEYIISPYPDVPPGDKIKLVFTEKLPEQINSDLFEVP